MNLVLFEAVELQADARVRVRGARATHLLRVLNVSPGSTVRVGVVDGMSGTGTVESIEDDSVTLHCAFDAPPSPIPRVDLLLALPRPKVMRRLWAQLASLGVGRILLTNAERVERYYFDTHVLDAAVYRPLFVEGLQQARDTRLPIVSIHRQLKVLIQDELDALFPAGQRLLADPAAIDPLSAVRSANDSGRVLLAVGPEGGWNDFERRLFAAHGFQSFTLGPRILRSDTACIALLALVHDAVG